MELKTIKQFVQENHFVTEGAMRWDVRNAQKNGMDDYDVIIRKGSTILINVDGYFEWLKSSPPSRKEYFPSSSKKTPVK